MATPVPPGTLLLSVPQMLDPNFMHSVVLMIEHNDQGALGLVINQQVEVRLEDLLEGHPLLEGRDFPVYSGGPVGRDSLQFVHRLGQEISGGIDLGDGLMLGGRLDDLSQAFERGLATQENLRFFVGYSGWGEGQLTAEFSIGSWVPAPPDPDLCFSPLDREALWRLALSGLGDVGKNLAQLPPDVTWN